MSARPSPSSTTEKAGEIIHSAPLSLRSDQAEYLQLIVLAALVGILAAFGHVGFSLLIHGCSVLFLSLEWHTLGAGHPIGRLFLPVVLLSGGVAMLLLDYFYPGDVLGYGFPNFLEMVNLGNARIRRAWIFIKAMGAALSLGCGASVGREGPIAQIGGAIGSMVAQIGRLSTLRSKVLVAAGAGAGIAVTFNAPMGGMMFALEIVLLGETELGNLILVLISTFSAVVTSRGLFGDTAVFRPPPFVLNSYWEMVTYGIMGALLGAIAAGYTKIFHAAGGIFRQLPWPKWTKLGVGLTIVGLIAALLPDNLSDGYPVIQQTLLGNIRGTSLVGLGTAKFFASIISLNSGAPGGVFGPAFFIGTMTGGAVRQLCNLMAPGLTGPIGSYALVGLGAFLAGLTHAPLTAILLLFEMTRLDPVLALPAIIATVMALIVAHEIEPESIDTYSLARQGKSLSIGRERLILRQLPLSSVITRDVQTLRANASVHEVLGMAGDTAQSTLPVLDDDSSLIGLIVTRDLLSMLASGTELGPLVNAYDLSRQNPPVLMPESSLDEASQLMEYEALEELPVIEHMGLAHGKFLGLVSRRNIAQAFNRVAASLTAIGRSDPHIVWASGYRVSRLLLPRAASGKTLRQLDPRGHFGVSVLAVQDSARPDAGFATAAPDQPLKEGDLIIAAGRSVDLRHFRSALEAGWP